MSESYQPRRKKVSRARERYIARQRLKEGGSSPSFPWQLPIESAHLNRAVVWGNRGVLVLRDAWWHVRNTPVLFYSLVAAVAGFALLFLVTHLAQGRAFPNVWSMGIHIGDLTVEEIEQRLLAAWENEIRIELIDGDRVWEAAPAEMGMSLKVQPIAEAARNAGLAGIPLGWSIDPVIEIEQGRAQEFMLNLAQQAEIRPLNARFKLENGQVVGVTGSDGRMMDVAQAVERLNQSSVNIIKNRRMDMVMTTLEPEVYEPQEYLEEAQALVNRPFEFLGYDPFKNEYISWKTTPEVFVSWLEAGGNGLTLHEETFAPFLEAQNASLETDSQPRYLDSNETMDKVRAAIIQKTEQIYLRVRYRSTRYEVAYGDRAYSIARKTGIPFFLIEEANAGRDLNTLSPGDILNIPSRDVTLPLDPVPHKRIVVNLSNQSLVAYENGQEVFRWLISSGMSQAPTSPGVFQVLSHSEIAAGSSYTLCSDQGCGQWQMYWFMGIYEVTPGLMNGFHGAVLLPNGTYLGGGSVGQPYTFGCIMSQNENAEALYRWAEEGTIVEIISSEYLPQSELGRQAMA